VIALAWRAAGVLVVAALIALWGVIAGLKLMSPVVVRTFRTGPSPFNLPSAVSVFGPHWPPSPPT